MDYHEIDPPDSHRGLVKVAWALHVPPGGDWITHIATPDGCMELIRRVQGRSDWAGEQPECFVAGMISRPAALRLSSGSSFVGLRLWPWTWRALSGRSPVELIDRWADLASLAPGIELPGDIEAAFAMLHPALLDAGSQAMVDVIPRSHGCGEIARRAQVSPRAVQRWFARNVGVPPRTYLRLLRFSEAFAGLPDARSSLAAHAADHGFADQAHMAREFRALAGTPAAKAKPRGTGPFLAGN